MEVITAISYAAIALYGIGALFQRSANAHVIAALVMMLALGWHITTVLSLFEEVGGPLLALGCILGLVWLFTPSEDRGEMNSEAIESGGLLAGGIGLVVFVPVSVFLGLGLAHFYLARRIRREQEPEPSDDILETPPQIDNE